MGVNLAGVREKGGGVGGIGAAEDDGSGGHGGGSFSGEIRAGPARVYLVGGAVGCHFLWPLPTVMICVSISHLQLVLNPTSISMYNINHI